MAKLPSQREETLGGYIVHGIPFPVSTDEEGAAISQEDGAHPDRAGIQDHVPAFVRTGQPVVRGADEQAAARFARPRKRIHHRQPARPRHVFGAETKWIDITDVPAHVHAFTVCYFGSEEFLPERRSCWR